MPALLDLTGQRFGRLVVTARAANIGTNAGWDARCDCGQTATVASCKLRTGRTRSCRKAS